MKQHHTIILDKKDTVTLKEVGIWLINMIELFLMIDMGIIMVTSIDTDTILKVCFINMTESTDITTG
jgi:hypothetical protein